MLQNGCFIFYKGLKHVDLLCSLAVTEIICLSILNQYTLSHSQAKLNWIHTPSFCWSLSHKNRYTLSTTCKTKTMHMHTDWDGIKHGSRYLAATKSFSGLEVRCKTIKCGMCDNVAVAKLFRDYRARERNMLQLSLSCLIPGTFLIIIVYCISYILYVE